MIEFQGCLTGATEEFFYKKSIQYGRNGVIILLLILLPSVVILLLIFKNLSILYGYIAVAIATLLMARIKLLKDRKKITPKKIYIMNDMLVSICDEINTSRFIDDIKEIRDYGEFYYIVFHFKSPSEKFVCQKSLLAKGTLEDFESLFNDKIVSCNIVDV